MYSILSLSAVAAVLVALFASSGATNYDALLHDIQRRSQHAHDLFMDAPGVRDHVYQELGSLYNEDGYLNALPAEEGDSDAQWQRILKSVNTVREARKSDLRSLREKLRNDERFYNAPFALEGAEDDEDDDSAALTPEQRSEEVAYKNHLNGEQKVSGGSGKQGIIKPNGSGAHQLEVKTDKLPGYCDPPNPCPVGVDPEKLPAPCDTNIPNTKAFNKQWIWTKMQNGECSCDTEHMDSCPSPRGDALGRQIQADDMEKRIPQMHRSVVKKAGPYNAF